MHDHGHDHSHGASGPRLRFALALTLGFALVEVAGGVLSGSLTLLGDAGHMFTDAMALGMAAAAAWLALRPPSDRHSYGFGRIEVVAALVNALFMLGVVTGIAIEAIERLSAPAAVSGGMVIGVAAAGLGINGVVAWILSRGEETLNTRGALLHVIGDLLGSVAALIAGTVIYFTGWTLVDPILALLVCLLILYSTLHLIHDSLHMVMEGVPPHLDLPEIGKAMAGVDNVRSVHDLHIWALASGMVALSAHVVVRDIALWESTLAELGSLLHDDYGIEHTTLQPETGTSPLVHMPGDGSVSGES